ncbi:MAG: hypothetical protein ACOYIN_00655 [Christensenellales bacterium]|jgi:transcriptional antiterminator Rof (Rho-off)|nr:hypothetical protein [Eubacteriales bacterium]
MGGLSDVRQKLSEWFSRLKKIKNIEFIACVFILAIVLLIYSGIKTAGQKKDTAGKNTEQAETVKMTDEEERLAALLGKIEGVGEVRVMINRDAAGNCSSVVVVAEGASSTRVRLMLVEAVEAALTVPGSGVEIYAMD